MAKPFIICIIDDDQFYQFSIKTTIQIKKLARKILVFSDGEEAMDFMIANVANNPSLPDVIFLDINMPIMDGFQFMEEYVKISPKIDKKITIYMVSSSVDPVDLKRAQQFNEISDYIVKPIKPEQLSDIVEKLEIGVEGE